MTAQLYFQARVSGAQVRANARCPIFVELFCGTGSMSNEACDQRFFDEITLDIDDKFMEPTFKCDILEVDDNHPLVSKIKSYISRGHLIVMHASPPCTEFSPSKTVGYRDIDGAMELVFHAYDLMKKYSTVFTIENPNTNCAYCLWKQQDAIDTFKHMKFVNYCQYGSLMKKDTGFALSSSSFADKFKPLRCPGDDECQACVYNHTTKRYNHRNIEGDDNTRSVPISERIAIPKQLCRKIIHAGKQEAYELAMKIADELDVMNAQRTPSPHKRSRNSVNYCELSDDSDTDDDTEFNKNDIIIYLEKATDILMVSENFNLMKYREERYYVLHAIHVNNIIFKNKDMIAVNGNRYIGNLDHMCLSEEKENKIIQDSSIVWIYDNIPQPHNFQLMDDEVEHIRKMIQQILTKSGEQKNTKNGGTIKKRKREARNALGLPMCGRLTPYNQQRVEEYLEKNQ